MQNGFVSGVAALLLVSAAASAQPVPPNRVVVAWDEKALSDEDYARIVTAIAGDVEPAQWPIEIVRPGDGLETIVDRRYDFYKVARRSEDPRWDRPLPKTVDALIDLIVKENGVDPGGLREGQRLRVPPVPVRPKTIADGSAPLRLYDPQSGEFALLEGNRLSEPSVAERRTATRTGIALSPQAAAGLGHVDAAADPDAPPPPPSGEPPVGAVLASDPGTLAHVRLLQGPCPAPDISQQRSPYLAAARAVLAERLPELRKRAMNRKLAFVDFDFGGKKGHGAKVRSAAEWLLAQLGVPELAAGLEEFDLAVPSDRIPEHLKATLIQYQSYAAPFGLTQAEVAQAALWMFAPSPNISEQVRTVPPPLLQAALWTHMQKGSWLNISWEIVSASRAVPANLTGLLHRGSFVTVAAGNERRELDAERAPQDEAAARPEFVNVTFGSADGEIYGTSTSSEGGRVDVVASGCGFTFGHLAPGDRGSSYAAPVAATAAWLRHLLDGTTAKAMRPQLTRASVLVPPRTATVMAGGVFDPARLLASPGPHYVDRPGNQVVALSGGTIVTDACGTFPRPGTPPTGQHVVVYEQAGQFFIVHRSERAKSPFVEISDPCAVGQLTATGTVAGQPWRIGSVEEFVKAVSHVTF